MRSSFTLLAALAALFLSSCNVPPQETEVLSTVQMARPAFYFEDPMAGESPVCSAGCDPIRLHFYGWDISSDSVVTISFPEQARQCGRCILNYRMGAYKTKPGEWDMTTMIMMRDNRSGEVFEIARAITPYGNSFGPDWKKDFYLDVTEYIPMLDGDVEFYVYYGGWDATDERGHTATLTFNFYRDDSRPKPVFFQKIYDSRANYNNGYRHWAYGVAGHDIEDAERLGLRSFEVPENVKELVMKVSITGHGQEYGGTWPDNPSKPKGHTCAEFARNSYTVVVNDVEKGVGDIFYDNSNTYKQAGTYKYNRANWGPGLPITSHWWLIQNMPEDRKVSIDLNLERYISIHDNPKADAVAQYIVEVDVFGYSE